MKFLRNCVLMTAVAISFPVAALADFPDPPSVVLPTEKAALAVAEAILAAIYGEEVINDEKPFSASLDGDVWKINGRPNRVTAEYAELGGKAFIHLSRKSGCVLQLGHTQ